jgi:hypothetical protein
MHLAGALRWPAAGLANEPAALASSEYTRPIRYFARKLRLTKKNIPFLENLEHGGIPSLYTGAIATPMESRLHD